ncbi:glyoxalase [Sphingomonas sp. DBB INV C78]|uniref:VOC family protein n=1 Tax=Sphingomonas sp. DBB INV C78 TaxID=3349434 RepID=UPI0036D2A8D2
MGVLGIGGIFFRAREPEALLTWYQTHLGVGHGCVAEGAGEPNEWVWQTMGGPVVFQPFKADSDYFPADKQWMINLRVSDMDGLLETLRAEGVAVITKAEWDATPEIGRFARIHDPEGNAIELWEPPTGA